ncbi:MAG: outer membrane beta-barrel protein [Sandaracinaceae bacterium]
MTTRTPLASRLPLILSLAALVVLGAWPARASAHPPGRSFRLGLGTPVFSAEAFPEPDITRYTFGIIPTTFGIQVGYQASQPLGFVLELLGGGTSDQLPGEDVDFVVFAVTPRFEYMFTPHEVVAPYSGAGAGYRLDGDPDGDLRDLVNAGGFFGLHLFADANASEFSLDIEGRLDLLYDIDTENAGIRGVLYFAWTGWFD